MLISLIFCLRFACPQLGQCATGYGRMEHLSLIGHIFFRSPREHRYTPSLNNNDHLSTLSAHPQSHDKEE